MTGTYDVAVLGAGTAGCVTAGRLAEAGLSVVLVEAGPDSTAAREATVPELAALRDPTRMHELWDSALDWGWRTVPQAYADGRRLHLPRGRVVGGSHGLNAMVWVRGLASDYDGWAALGNPGWAWPDVEPVFRALEGEEPTPVASLTGYRKGPVDVVTDFDPQPIHRSLVTAGAAAGVRFNPDYNSGDPLGMSYTQLTIRGGRRWMTADGFLTRRVARCHGPTPGAVTVLSEHLVDRLAIRDGRCVGAEVLDQRIGEPVRIGAGEFVLALGALADPGALLRSGIGDPRVLRRAGIDLTVDSPRVGAGLVDHWLVPTVWQTERDPGASPGLPSTQSHLFAASRPGGPIDLQPIVFSAPLVPDGMSPIDRGFSLMAGLIRPASRGRVWISGPDPTVPPLIDPRVLSEPGDLEALCAAVRLCVSIGDEAGLASMWGARRVVPADLEDAQIRSAIRSTVVTYHHSAGTCAMGPTGVVDERLRVRGVSGLRVADASIMPTIVTGNTNAAAALIGWKAADFILEGR